MKFRNSGLYDKAFYNIEYMSIDTIHKLYDYIEFNEDLIIKYEIDKDDLIDADEDKIHKFVDGVKKNSFIYNYYYQVDELDYNEDIAFKCNLIPFKINSCGYDASPKLDAYFFMLTGCMDKYSKFFSDYDYFKSMVSDEILEKLNNLKDNGLLKNVR